MTHVCVVTPRLEVELVDGELAALRGVGCDARPVDEEDIHDILGGGGGGGGGGADGGGEANDARAAAARSGGTASDDARREECAAAAALSSSSSSSRAPRRWLHRECVRESADWVIDEGKPAVVQWLHAPDDRTVGALARHAAHAVAPCDVVSVTTWRLDAFFAHVAPRLRAPIVLHTSDCCSDLSAPQPCVASSPAARRVGLALPPPVFRAWWRHPPRSLCHRATSEPQHDQAHHRTTRGVSRGAAAASLPPRYYPRGRSHATDHLLSPLVAPTAPSASPSTAGDNSETAGDDDSNSSAAAGASVVWHWFSDNWHWHDAPPPPANATATATAGAEVRARGRPRCRLRLYDVQPDPRPPVQCGFASVTRDATGGGCFCGDERGHHPYTSDGGERCGCERPLHAYATTPHRPLDDDARPLDRTARRPPRRARSRARRPASTRG